MSGDRGISLPVAALGVLAFFFSTTLLTHHAFDLLRLGEGDVVRHRSLTQPPVEARLWEDPLAAVVRHQERVKEFCKDPEASRRTPGCPLNAAPGSILPEADNAGAGANLSVIAALVPGASFVGVEEARRRMRFAVLAGLASQGFVPENSERLGLLRVPLCDSFEDCGPGGARPGSLASLDVPYETLVTEYAAQQRRVAILWLDDSKLGRSWLRTVTIMLGDVAPRSTERLSILGPYTSDKLVDALENVASLAQSALRGGTESQPGSPFCENWKRLKRLALISPFSTAHDRQLIEFAGAAEARFGGPNAYDVCDDMDRGAAARVYARKVGDPIDQAFQQQLVRLPAEAPAPFFLRTIGPDSVQIALLREELCARGLGDGRGGRIVILREWDSLYSRSLAKELGTELDCPGSSPGLTNARFDVYSYLGGIDGVTLEGAPKQQRLVPRASGSRKGDDKEPEVEWPENRDQRDYLRRLVTRLQNEAELDPRNAVRAVGIIGQDVHDKLVLSQALRPAFPERMIFTTDMDARLLHPDVAKYTRNLVVASALPLSPSDLVPAISHNVRAPPFRDIYQTATFLGIRYAALMSDSDRAREREAISKQLGKVHLYEIGRRGEMSLASRDYSIDDRSVVQLRPEKLSADQLRTRQFYGGLYLMLVAALGAFIVFVKPGPALGEALMASAPFSVSTMAISGLVVGSWGFAAGVGGELALPGRVGLSGAICIALACALLFWIAVYPGPQASRAMVAAGTAKRWVLGQQFLRSALFVAILAAVVVVVPVVGSGTHEPFAFFSGVSGWPSELLRAFAVLLFGWFVDHTWRGTARTTCEIGLRYFAVETAPKTRIASVIAYLRRNPARAGRFVLRRVVKGVLDATLWKWRPQIVRRTDAWTGHGAIAGAGARPSDDGGIDGTRIWRRYIRLLHDGPRFLRTLFWLALVFFFVALEIRLFGGETPEVPARGLEDRSLFSATIVMAVIAAIILMVLVSDATILTWRFILVLRDKRTIYPRETVRRFASELGPQLEKQAALPITARVRDREVPGAPRRNSILDPWIDARLLADHTAAIAPLIFFPLILLGLLFIARSPLFDNWGANNVVIVVLVTYLLWTIAMATMLNISAEMARRTALEAMRRDLLWLKGAGETHHLLAECLSSLIRQVEELRRGAFAPFFEQPLVRAVLVPLGGAGGIQLLELLAFVRS